MKIIVATDKFKGCLTSQEVGASISAGIHEVLPDCETIVIPIADGGDGTMRALTECNNGEIEKVEVCNPINKTITAEYGIIHQDTAVIDVASASGLHLIDKTEANPLYATSQGTGELILAALQKGYKKIIIGVGGSATNDAGIGILSVLGFKFFDKKGQEISASAKHLIDIASIDSSHVTPLLEGVHITILCDVDASFYGKNGATQIFSAQKGATEEIKVQLESGMQNFAQVILHQTGKEVQKMKYAGAAGGIAGSLCALLDAELTNGITQYLEQVNFENIVKDADLVITGEGKMDKQTLLGKAPYGVCLAAHRFGKETIAIVGTLEDTQELTQSQFAEILSIKSENTPLSESMQPENAKRNIFETTKKWIASRYR